LAADEVVLAGFVPGSCVAKPKHVVGTSRRARQQEAHDGHDAQADQHHDLSMDERGFGPPIARLAATIDKGTAATDA
jgi:hypothetical protein